MPTEVSQKDFFFKINRINRFVLEVPLGAVKADPVKVKVIIYHKFFQLQKRKIKNKTISCTCNHHPEGLFFKVNTK